MISLSDLLTNLEDDKNVGVQFYECDRCGHYTGVKMTWAKQEEFIRKHFMTLRGKSVCLCDECLKELAIWLMAKKES